MPGKPVLWIPIPYSLAGVVFLRRGKINILATIFYAGIMCIHAVRSGWYLYGLTTTTKTMKKTTQSSQPEGKGVVTRNAANEKVSST